MSRSKRPVITDDFKKEAVRLIATSGRTFSETAADLGVDLSTLTRWKRQLHEADLLLGPHEDAKELARLRKENEILKRAATFFAKVEEDKKTVQ
ncbi:hypothetical protein GCM10008943_33250 [Paenochrobactrum glaciei]|uniref:Transposase n=1 Tax=Paenochrobactrum glaciei TaxID=486407 RepID=A0ABN1GP52_9HYPH